MNLEKLTHEIWKDERVKELGIRKNEVRLIMKIMVEKLIDGLFEYGKIKIRGLFTLEIRKAKGRRIANPQNGEIMNIDDYYKLGIEPSEKIKSGLKEMRQ